MKVHELKVWSIYMERLLTGQKTFEIRKNDRDFQTGDWLTLREWNTTLDRYGDNQITVQITYVLHGGQFGLQDGYVALGFANPFTQTPHIQ